MLLVFIITSIQFEKTVGFFFSELCTPNAVGNKDSAFLLLSHYSVMKLKTVMFIYHQNYHQKNQTQK